MKFGDNLKKLRKSKKLSQEELAEKVGVSRQSVSKWETSEAYPEMNNILQLCRIFHCHINDLVNDSIIDAGSLDDEVKMNIVKLKKEEQKKMKGLSKAISVIAKIGRVCVIIGVVIIALVMAFIPCFVNSVDVKENEIIINNQKITLDKDNSALTLKYNDIVLADVYEDNDLKYIQVFQNNSKTAIIIYLEIGFLVLLVTLILITIILKHLEKLFDNINKGDTPFTLENVSHIKKMAYLMIVTIILPSISGAIFTTLITTAIDIDFELFNLVEILFLFSMVYIFQYGYEIQLDSKGRMYGENE